jgi:hypothetical protein
MEPVGLAAVLVAAHNVVTRPYPSHNPINFDLFA